jgi:hypothetical protein
MSSRPATSRRGGSTIRRQGSAAVPAGPAGIARAEVGPGWQGEGAHAAGGARGRGVYVASPHELRERLVEGFGVTSESLIAVARDGWHLQLCRYLRSSSRSRSSLHGRCRTGAPTDRPREPAGGLEYPSGWARNRWFAVDQTFLSSPDRISSTSTFHSSRLSVTRLPPPRSEPCRDRSRLPGKQCRPDRPTSSGSPWDSSSRGLTMGATRCDSMPRVRATDD